MFSHARQTNRFFHHFPLLLAVCKICARKKCLRYLLLVYCIYRYFRRWKLCSVAWTQWAWNVTSQVIVNQMQLMLKMISSGMEYRFSFVGKLVPFTVHDYTFVSLVKLCGWSAIDFSILFFFPQSIGLRIQVRGILPLKIFFEVYWDKYECVTGHTCGKLSRICHTSFSACAFHDFMRTQANKIIIFVERMHNCTLHNGKLATALCETVMAFSISCKCKQRSKGGKKESSPRA